MNKGVSFLETGIHNTSEIGRLKKVLLHRPGGELENLMPEYLERLLFDDIPYLKEAQREHDAFADCLRQQGVEVVYLTDLVAGSLVSPEIRQSFLTQFLAESGVKDPRTPGPAAGLSGAPFRQGAGVCDDGRRPEKPAPGRRRQAGRLSLRPGG